MALTGQAAMLLAFDVVADAVVEHDDWHTHEHFPERLSIPGFRRGTRWTATGGGPRYFVMYEVETIDVLASAPYLQRLNNPTPWTSKMMVHYRGMTRGFCAVAGDFGAGLGTAGLLIRYTPASKDAALRDWLRGEALPGLAARPGLVSAHLFESALTPPPTKEQSLRGADAPFASAVLVTGYDAARVAELQRAVLTTAAFEARGASAVSVAAYSLGVSLTPRELHAAT